MHIVDINDKFKDEKHQIGMWRGDMADSRQYRFAFINSDRRPIPVPPFMGYHVLMGAAQRLRCCLLKGPAVRRLLIYGVKFLWHLRVPFIA